MVRTKAKTTWVHMQVKNHKFSLINSVFQLLDLTSLSMCSSHWNSQKRVVQEWFRSRSTTSPLFPDPQGDPLSTTSHFQVKALSSRTRAATPECAKQVRATACLWGQLGQLSEANRAWEVVGVVGVRGGILT